MDQNHDSERRQVRQLSSFKNTRELRKECCKSINDTQLSRFLWKVPCTPHAVMTHPSESTMEGSLAWRGTP